MISKRASGKFELGVLAAGVAPRVPPGVIPAAAFEPLRLLLAAARAPGYTYKPFTLADLRALPAGGGAGGADAAALALFTAGSGDRTTRDVWWIYKVCGRRGTKHTPALQRAARRNTATGHCSHSRMPLCASQTLTEARPRSPLSPWLAGPRLWRSPRPLLSRPNDVLARRWPASHRRDSRRDRGRRPANCDPGRRICAAGAAACCGARPWLQVHAACAD